MKCEIGVNKLYRAVIYIRERGDKNAQWRRATMEDLFPCNAFMRLFRSEQNTVFSEYVDALTSGRDIINKAANNLERYNLSAEARVEISNSCEMDAK